MILLEDELPWSLPIGQMSLKSDLPSKKNNIIFGLLDRTIFKPLIKHAISQICQCIFFFFHKVVVITKWRDHWHLIKELKSQLKEGLTERGITRLVAFERGCKESFNSIPTNWSFLLYSCRAWKYLYQNLVKRESNTYKGALASCTTILTIVNPEPRIRSVSPSHNSLESLLPPKPSHSYSTIQYVIIHSLVTTAVKCKQPHKSIDLHHEKNEKKVIFFWSRS